MSSAIRNETRAGGVEVHVCNDCRAWSRKGEPLRHSKRCETPNDQPEIDEAAVRKSTRDVRALAANLARKSAAEVKRLGCEGHGLSADEAFDAQQRGEITTSEAMNRDD